MMGEPASGDQVIQVIQPNIVIQRNIHEPQGQCYVRGGRTSWKLWEAPEDVLYLLVPLPHIPQHSLSSWLWKDLHPVGKLEGHPNARKATVSDLSAKGHAYISKGI